MPYKHRDLHLTYTPRRGYSDFVLHHQPPGPYGSSLHANQAFESSTSSRYAAEWLNRLTECDPTALHVTLVRPHNAPNLWHPCSKDDPDSPSAVSDIGCLCIQTFVDPVTYLPVVAHHDYTPSVGVDRWSYRTYAPVALPEEERLTALIIDSEADMFWVRTDRGTLHILPEGQGSGYGVGYGGGGPGELARMIQKIVESDGFDVTAGTSIEHPLPTKVDDWVSSSAADRTQELTLDQLKTLCRTGMVV